MSTDSLRAHILDECRAYFAEKFAPAPFVAGVTHVPVTAKSMAASDLVALVDASLDLWLTSGRYAHELERLLPAHYGCDTPAVLVNSGSSANLVAVSALGTPMFESLFSRRLQPGDEVITAAAGFPTTVNPIVQNGWRPVFVDVDLATLNATPEQIMEARSPRTRAVVLAHTLGNPYRADVLASWCEREGLFLIEDRCDALGATIGGRRVGSFGEYATASFYPAHHITTGEGGAVMARNGRLKRVAESVRDWGRDCWCETGKDNTCGKRFDWQLGEMPEGYDHKYVYSNIGYNLKLTDMQAAIGVAQIARVDQFIATRRRNWARLAEGIASSPILSASFIPVKPTPGTEPSWFGFAVHCAPGVNRNRVVRFLDKCQIGTRLLFAGNLTRQPAYQGVDYRVVGSLKSSDAIVDSTFWMGCHPGLDDVHIAYMLESLEAAADECRRTRSLLGGRT